MANTPDTSSVPAYSYYDSPSDTTATGMLKANEYPAKDISASDSYYRPEPLITTEAPIASSPYYPPSLHSRPFLISPKPSPYFPSPPHSPLPGHDPYASSGPNYAPYSSGVPEYSPYPVSNSPYFDNRGPQHSSQFSSSYNQPVSRTFGVEFYSSDLYSSPSQPRNWACMWVSCFGIVCSIGFVLLVMLS
mmetsp:Transcript_301/g.344  ORF Transcript_301/g.344 Transcript_301/m.344 type:complete len:190 (+) Transcript_301:719-1288(+)